MGRIATVLLLLQPLLHRSVSGGAYSALSRPNRSIFSPYLALFTRCGPHTNSGMLPFPPWLPQQELPTRGTSQGQREWH